MKTSSFALLEKSPAERKAGLKTDFMAWRADFSGREARRAHRNNSQPIALTSTFAAMVDHAVRR
ncbi:MAG TPA: hypothetical protein VGL42_16915 [Opitutaceae bacterium]|jgi:hypothetical protein